MLYGRGVSPSLDVNSAVALSHILFGEMLRGNSTMKEQMALEGKLMKGRQVLHEVCKPSKIS